MNEIASFLRDGWIFRLQVLPWSHGDNREDRDIYTIESEKNGSCYLYRAVSANTPEEGAWNLWDRVYETKSSPDTDHSAWERI